MLRALTILTFAMVLDSTRAEQPATPDSLAGDGLRAAGEPVPAIVDGSQPPASPALALPGAQASPETLIASDPMLPPWYGPRLALAKEQYDQVLRLIELGDADRARVANDLLRREYADTPWGEESADLQVRIDRIQVSPERPHPHGARVPEAVLKGATAVIDGPNPMVLVGDEWLAVGDRVPTHPAVSVGSIEGDVVRFSLDGSVEEVVVDGSI